VYQKELWTTVKAQRQLSGKQLSINSWKIRIKDRNSADSQA